MNIKEREAIRIKTVEYFGNLLLKGEISKKMDDALFQLLASDIILTTEDVDNFLQFIGDEYDKGPYVKEYSKGIMIRTEDHYTIGEIEKCVKLLHSNIEMETIVE